MHQDTQRRPCALRQVIGGAKHVVFVCAQRFTRIVLAPALVAVPLIAGCKTTPDIDLMLYSAKFDNDPWSYYELAELYTAGTEVPKDDAEATKLYGLAAEAGIPWAQYTYGDRLVQGLGLARPDPTLGMTWLAKAANNNVTAAYTALGEIHATGVLGKKNQTEAAEWYLKAAKAGDGHAQAEMANRYATGLGVPQDEALATRWRLSAAKRGDAWSQVDLAERLLIGKGAKPNPEAALKVMQRAAKNGNVFAQRRVAEIYDRGLAGPADPTVAILWLMMAANGGDTDAQYESRDPSYGRHRDGSEGLTTQSAGWNEQPKPGTSTPRRLWPSFTLRREKSPLNQPSHSNGWSGRPTQVRSLHDMSLRSKAPMQPAWPRIATRRWSGCAGQRNKVTPRRSFDLPTSCWGVAPPAMRQGRTRPAECTKAHNEGRHLRVVRWLNL